MRKENAIHSQVLSIYQNLLFVTKAFNLVTGLSRHPLIRKKS